MRSPRVRKPSKNQGDDSSTTTTTAGARTIWIAERHARRVYSFHDFDTGGLGGSAMPKPTAMLPIAALCLLLAGCSNHAATTLNAQDNWTSTTTVGKITALTVIVPAKPDQNHLLVFLRDPNHKPVKNASILATARSNSAGNSSAPLQATAIAPGAYRIISNLPGGQSTVDLTLNTPAQANTHLTLDVAIAK